MLRRWQARSQASDTYGAGISGDLDAWLKFNRSRASRRPRGLGVVAPFPPAELMKNTTGLERNKHFAKHGAHFVRILSDAGPPRPLSTYVDVLDFGVGVGRLARMFKGTSGRYTGVDVDARHVAWVDSALDYVDAFATLPRHPLPFEDGRFDCIISVSVFTHMNEKDQEFYLSELARVSQPGATVMLTVHGQRALKRANAEKSVLALLDIPRSAVHAVGEVFPDPGFCFVRQDGHLTSDDYEYGITFVGESYIDRVWSRYFDVEAVCSGAIHDFQDVVVLTAR